MTPQTPVEIGSLLAGKYRIDRVLGQGGMGIVIAATHVHLDQEVAIKFLLSEALESPEVVARFAREARAAARIRGQHVARVIDVGALDTGAPYIVMEYLEGKDLAELLLAHGPFSIPDAVSHLLQACEALAEAHAAGIVHRDIKPANLFLAATADRSAIIKVLDFGISKAADPASGPLTRTSAVLGSVCYLSPEQLISPNEVDSRADVWALGIVLYQLLTGRVPFDAGSMPEIVALILKNEPVPVRELRADVPPELAAAMASCMKTAASERFQTVLDFARAIAPFGPEASQPSIDRIARLLGQAAEPTEVAPPTLPTAGHSPSIPRWMFGFASCLIVVLIGGVGVLVAFRSQAKPPVVATPPSAVVPVSEVATPPSSAAPSTSVAAMPAGASTSASSKSPHRPHAAIPNGTSRSSSPTLKAGDLNKLNKPKE